MHRFTQDNPKKHTGNPRQIHSVTKCSLRKYLRIFVWDKIFFPIKIFFRLNLSRTEFHLGLHNVLGTGASAVQIVPSVAPQVEHMYVFQRTAPWIFQKPDFAYPGWMKVLFRIYPPLMLLQRFTIFLFAEGM